ncbi:MAG: HAD family hydrolase [Rudaea sp.]
MVEQQTFSAGNFDAVLFDMDGVVTDTAEAHAAAWKRLFDEYLEQHARRAGEAFRPFDAEGDYHRYVDGKPRRDGVDSFLASRGIKLPRGNLDDDFEQNTVSGLANRKDSYFTAWLAKNKVRAFPGTLAFISALKRRGIKIALFSSSHHATAVLRSAGVLRLFDAKVDGDDLERQHLPGKPDPAMLLEAATRLGVVPARSIIVEDAIAGVEAGKRGGFGLVIGVDRGHNAAALQRAGASIVVRDLAELGWVAGEPP